jgi:hypothetical protein
VTTPFADRISLASLTVAYEVEQMADAALAIDAALTVPIHHALLESTLLHARALIEFLLNGKEKRDIRPRTCARAGTSRTTTRAPSASGSWA